MSSRIINKPNYILTLMNPISNSGYLHEPESTFISNPIKIKVEIKREGWSGFAKFLIWTFSKVTICGSYKLLVVNQTLVGKIASVDESIVKYSFYVIKSSSICTLMEDCHS